MAQEAEAVPQTELPVVAVVAAAATAVQALLVRMQPDTAAAEVVAAPSLAAEKAIKVSLSFRTHSPQAELDRHQISQITQYGRPDLLRRQVTILFRAFMQLEVPEHGS